MFDFHLVRSTDVRQRQGYAAAISEQHSLPATMIYDRNTGLVAPLF